MGSCAIAVNDNQRKKWNWLQINNQTEFFFFFFSHPFCHPAIFYWYKHSQILPTKLFPFVVETYLNIIFKKRKQRRCLLEIYSSCKEMTWIPMMWFLACSASVTSLLGFDLIYFFILKTQPRGCTSPGLMYLEIIIVIS